MIGKIIRFCEELYVRSSNFRFCTYLRDKGIKIGGGNKFRPKTTQIDLTRPSLITIGDNCYFNENFCILTHDWVTHVFINSERKFLPSSGRVTIGNNVSTGQNVTILKGVTIGDNVFIGAHSVVTKDIPSNSIAVGIPARVVSTIEDYYQKRQIKCIEEALDYARSISERYGRRPVTTDFWEEFTLFVDGSKIDDYPELKEIIKRQCGPMYKNYIDSHKAQYDGFDDFLNAAGIK